MFTATLLPPEVRRPGRLHRVLSALGLGTAALVLVAINFFLFVALPYFVASPEGLYHRVWRSTAEHIYDPAALGDWKQWEHKYDGKLNTDEDAEKAIGEMLDSIKDRYTYFMNTKAVSAETEREQGNFTGVGIVFEAAEDANGQLQKAPDGSRLPKTDKDGFPVVKQVMNGGPAQAQGLRAGDAITSVNGKDTKNVSLDALVTQVRGEAGTAVTFGVRRDGQDSTITVTRQTINVPAVTTKHLTNGIGYIRLEGFDQMDAADEFQKGLEDLKDCKALIVDLRGNPGGFVHNAVNIASFFIEEGTVVSIRQRIPGDPAKPHYETQTLKLAKSVMDTETTDTRKPGVTGHDADPRKPYLAAGRPVVVLVDGGSASASEMFTGALKDNNAATVVGTRTFGKGIGQSTVRMPNSTQLHVTSLRYFTPNGTWLGDGGNTQSHGIEPNVTVEAAPGLTFGEANDNQLEKAIEVITNKLGGGSERPLFRTLASCAG